MVWLMASFYQTAMAWTSTSIKHLVLLNISNTILLVVFWTSTSWLDLHLLMLPANMLVLLERYEPIYLYILISPQCPMFEYRGKFLTEIQPAQQSYWTYGFHQCKYGYQDVMMMAEVVYNYSQAGIPLETVWNDIDYMNLQQTWTVDPDRFPIEKVQELVTYLHEHQQHYIMMVDPPVSLNDSTSYNNGLDADVFIQYDNGTEFLSVMWPGVVSYVDFFHPNSQDFWSGQIGSFFNDSNGIGVDGIWIDMNEVSIQKDSAHSSKANVNEQPANFCGYPCPNPAEQAVSMTKPQPPPPARTVWAPLPGFPSDFQPPSVSKSKRDSPSGNMTGLPDRDLITPPYNIGHTGPLLSTGTIGGDLPLYGGYTAYDTHNLYASQMIAHTRQGLLDRRSTERPFIISRSTFAGDGRKAGHWTGDNASWWSHYLLSIVQHMEFASIFQIPMVGSDVCGFDENTTETLCARWAMLGAWYPFYRNHADTAANFQEFYRWPLVTEVAKKAIATRFQLMDYFYTSFYQQTLDGSPTTITPLFFQYPEDPNTLEISYQFFYGPSILVSPVTVENATNVTFYLPEDSFYDFWTGEKMPETGLDIYYDNVTYMDIPVHIRGGSILPLRINADQVNTTTQLREQDFELIVALDNNGKAKGNLYLDDGISINSSSSFMELTYDNGHFVVNGTFGYQTNITIQYATIYGTNKTAPPIYSLKKALNSAWTTGLTSANNTISSRKIR